MIRRAIKLLLVVNIAVWTSGGLLYGVNSLRGNGEVSRQTRAEQQKLTGELGKKVARLERELTEYRGQGAVLGEQDQARIENRVFAGTNLLRNSSFEAHTGNQPRQWRYQLSSTTDNTKVTKEGIRSGSWGLKLSGETPLGISQPETKTVPGRTYTFSAYLKAVNVNPNTLVKLGFWNERQNRYGTIQEFEIGASTREWYRISMSATTDGIITDSVNWFPILEVHNLTTGSIYLDDFSLVQQGYYNSALAYSSSSGLTNGMVVVNTNGDIYPAQSGVGSLGTSGNRWDKLYLSGAAELDSSLSVAGTTTLEGTLAVNSDKITTNDPLTLDASGYVRVGDDTDTSPSNADSDDDLYVQGSIETDNNMYVEGNLTVSGSQTFSGNQSITGNVTLSDDDWIGLGSSAGRIEFDNQATDEVNILAANVGIGTNSPSYALDVLGSINLSSGSSLKIADTNVLTGSSLGSGVTGSFLTGLGTISTGTWQADVIANSYIAQDLTVSSSGSVDDGALSANVSLLGQTISKDELADSGTLSFDWDDSEVADDLTIDSTKSIATTGNINSSGGALQTNGVTRIDNSGNATLGTASFSGDLTWTASSPSITLTDGETLTVSDGTNNLLTLNDTGDTADLTVGGTVTASSYQRSCPTGYIFVPGDPKYGTMPGFCVMKYEAKCSGSADGTGCNESSDTPISQAANKPWRSTVDQEEARAACQRVGDGYHLISEAEWMSIAENVARVDANWSSGTAGSGCLFRGNVGNNDSCGYNGADPEDGTGRDAKAELELTNGETIWDLSGNVWEWTDFYLLERDTAGTGNGDDADGVTDESPDAGGVTSRNWYEYTAVTDYAAAAHMRPPDTDWDSSYGIGKIYINPGYAYNGSSYSSEYHAVLRGGHWNDTANAGAFTVILNASPTYTVSYIGFRCAASL